MNNYDTSKITGPQRSIFFYVTSLSLVAYLSRIAEIFPYLTQYRVNLILLLLSALTFLGTGAYKKIRWQRNRGLHLMVALLFLSLILMPFSIWKSGSFTAIRDVLLINLFFFIFCQAAIEERDGLIGMIQVITISCAILLFGMYYHPVIVEGGRVSATSTYDSNDIAMVFACFFPFVFYLYVSMKSKKRIIILLLLMLLIFGVIKTGSRGGLLALMIAILQIFFSSHFVKNKMNKLMILLIVCAVLFSPIADTVRERWEVVITGEDYNISTTDSHTGGRLAIWRSGLAIFRDNFITGVGIGNVTVAMGNKYGDTGWRTSHNAFLQISLELGIFGLLIYLSILKHIWNNCSSILKIPRNTAQYPYEMRANLAKSTQISLASYIVAAFFLSQAYSVIIPFLIAFSSGLRLDEEKVSNGS